ncbi:MAG: trigger factor [Bacteriovoracaceae bacterium]|nr:trigger factor [Bacteriovoracaceae bacterium]
MSYQVETINSCTKKLIFNFDSVDLSKQIDKALQNKQKSVNLKGYRKGKAPLDMVKKLYGPQVENEALYSFVSEKFFDALESEGIKAVGYPNFGNTEYKQENKSVKFEATVETFPEFEIKNYSKLEFTKEAVEVTEKEIEDMKKNYLSSKAVLTEVNGAKLENGHSAVMNFEGEKEDGSKPANMAGKEFVLEIGSGQFIPGFEEQMVGMTVGEKRTISVVFPTDYQEESLRGKPVKFHIDLLEIKEKKMPELTDELAVEFGFKSATDMNEKMTKNLEYQKTRKVEEKLHQEILEKLVSENSFEVPRALIEQQKEAIKKDLSKNLQAQGFNDDMLNTYFSKWTADLEDKANFQVRSGLILDKIARKYGIESNEADLDQKLKEVSEQSGMEFDKLKGYYNSNKTLTQNMLYVIREEKTFQRLTKEMKVKTK